MSCLHRSLSALTGSVLFHYRSSLLSPVICALEILCLVGVVGFRYLWHCLCLGCFADRAGIGLYSLFFCCCRSCDRTAVPAVFCFVKHCIADITCLPVCIGIMFISFSLPHDPLCQILPHRYNPCVRYSELNSLFLHFRYLSDIEIC